MNGLNDLVLVHIGVTRLFRSVDVHCFSAAPSEVPIDITSHTPSKVGSLALGLSLASGVTSGGEWVVKDPDCGALEHRGLRLSGFLDRVARKGDGQGGRVSPT